MKLITTLFALFAIVFGLLIFEGVTAAQAPPGYTLEAKVQPQEVTRCPDTDRLWRRADRPFFQTGITSSPKGLMRLRLVRW